MHLSPTDSGLNKIKTELEDLSFRYDHPQEYANIEHKLADTESQRDTLFAEFYCTYPRRTR